MSDMTVSSNELLIRRLIRGSIFRAIQESVAAIIVAIIFGSMLAGNPAGSFGHYGCLLMLVGTGLIVGTVWSHALSYRLLKSHPADDARFWRKTFYTQARLLRWVPLWYCAPLCIGGMLLVLPAAREEYTAFLMVAGLFSAVFACVIWLNRKAAGCIERAARLLAG